MLPQLTVAVGVGGLPNLVQVDGVQAAAAKHREDLLLAEPAAIARAADERKELTIHSHPRSAAPVASSSSSSSSSTATVACGSHSWRGNSMPTALHAGLWRVLLHRVAPAPRSDLVVHEEITVQRLSLNLSGATASERRPPGVVRRGVARRVTG